MGSSWVSVNAMTTVIPAQAGIQFSNQVCMMKIQSRLVLAGMALVLAAVPVQPILHAQATAVTADVAYLAADRLEGRRIGSPGADSAAEYIARRFAALGLTAPEGGWFQTFTVSPSAPAAHGTPFGGVQGRNVIGILPGSNPALRDEYVIIGAHYDHLGLGGPGSLDPESHAIHNGADDNASGTAALFEIARRLREYPPARSVLFLAFSGEELGLLGSAEYVKAPVVPIAQSVAMINLDMVGRLRNDRLIVYGVETARELRPLLDSLNVQAGFDMHAQGDGYGPSDHSSFYAARMPVLHLFTDLHEDYHRPSDDAERIDAEGIVRVAAFAGQIATAVGNRPQRLAVVDLPRPAPPVGSESATGGYGAYLGSIPDMTDSPGGVRLSGVRSGSPADQAGLVQGDILIRIGEHDVADLMAMTTALRAHRPGDTVEVVYLRNGERHSARVTFGKREG